MGNNISYLAHATCVASFSLDRDIRYKVGDIERSFSQLLSTQAVGTNVADSAAPPIPRFTLQSGPKQLAVSQVSTQLDLNFREQKKAYEESLPVVKKNFIKFWEGVLKFKKETEITDIGLVLTINFPMEEEADFAGKIFRQFLKIPSLGVVASAGLQAGFLDEKDLMFSNISIGSYEMREGRLEAIHGEVSVIELERLPLKEVGVELKLDVNSKPMIKEGVNISRDTGEKLYGKAEDLVMTQTKDLLQRLIEE